MVNSDYSIKTDTADEFRKVATDLLRRNIMFSLSPICGIVYAMHVTRSGVEVCDTVEDDNYRRETFADLNSALRNFNVGGLPLERFVAGVTIYPVVTV